MSLMDAGDAPHIVHEDSPTCEDVAGLQENSRRLTTLLSNLPGMAYRCANDKHWTIEFVSEGCRDVTGYAPADLVNSARLSYADLIVPEDAAAVRDGVEAGLRDKAAFQLEYRIRHADGSVRWVWERGRGVFDAQGELLALEGFIADVTTHKLAEEDVRQRANQQAVIAELGRVALSGLEHDQLFELTVQRVSATLDAPICRILRYLPEEKQFMLSAGCGWDAGVVGRARISADRGSQAGYTFWSKNPVVVDDFSRETRFEVPPLLREHRVTSGVSVVIPGDDEPFGILGVFSAQPRRFAEREIRFVQVVANLLAHALQRALAEQRRLEMARQLRQAQKLEALGTLAAGVAHDFSNFATAVMGYLDLASGAATSGADVQPYLEGIRKATDQTQSITRSLLTFSRKLDVDRAPFSLVATVMEAVQLLKHLLPASITLEVVIPPGFDPWLYGHSGQLQQVVMNLAINARDAMPQGGKLRVLLAKDAAGGTDDAGRDPVKLIVEDSGCGIPPENLNRIFDPFFTTKARGRGTGLGLAIVHGIVVDHGGAVRASSTVGIGTSFTLQFPTYPQPTHQAVASAPAELPRGQGEVVLVAEDNELVRALLATTLRDNGYDVLQAADGAEAVALYDAHRERIDLVLLDCDLPHKTGGEALNEMRMSRPELPALIISGDVEAARPAAGKGITCFLPKPFAMAKLAATIAEVLHPPK